MTLALIIKGQRDTAERMAKFFEVPITIVKKHEGYVVAHASDSDVNRVGAWVASQSGATPALKPSGMAQTLAGIG